MGMTYDQLSMDERCEIYRLHADGKSRRAIAQSLGRAPSTICRKLVRNSGAKVGYKVEWAEIQARARRCLDFRTPLEVFLGQEISLGVALEM